MYQPPFRGKNVRGGRKPAPRLTSRQKQAKSEVARFREKYWKKMLRLARDYTSKHAHVSQAELILHFHAEYNIALPEKSAAEILRRLNEKK